MRPEGPVVNSPGREAGAAGRAMLSAEGAALEILWVPRLRRSDSRLSATPASRPGLLTAGPSGLNLWIVITAAFCVVHGNRRQVQ